MFAKVSLVAVLALAPWANGLLLQIPVGWQSSSEVNITWTSTASDSVFALQLVNTDEFHDTFSIANNLQPPANFAQFQLGVIPEGTYTLRAISPTNASDIFDQTPGFTVAGPPATTSSTSASSTSSGASSASGSSTSGAASASVTSPGSGSTTSGFGHTISGGSSTQSSAGSDSTSGTGTTTGSGSTATNFNGAASVPVLAPWAVLALGAVAGAAAAL